MILVTGGTGYLGKSVVSLLEQRGLEPSVFSRRMGGDITDVHSVRRAVKGCDAVIHLAASKDHTGDYKAVHRINVRGTANVLKAAAQEGLDTVVYCSSVAAAESIKLPYSVSKRRAEEVARRYQRQLTVPILRLAPVYDSKRLEPLLKWKLFPLLNIQLHLVWKEAAAKALVLALEKGKSKTYTIADKQPVQVEDLYEAVSSCCRAVRLPGWAPRAFEQIADITAAPFRLLGKRPPITADLIRAYTQDRAYDIRPAIKDLGYKPVDTIKKWRELVCEKPTPEQTAN